VLAKVIFGDSEEVLKSFSDNSIHLIVTSPPYYTMRNQMKWNSYEEYLEKMRRIFVECFRILRPGRVCIVNVCDYLVDGTKYPIPADFIRMLISIGFKYEDDIIWVKPLGVGKNNGSGKRAGNFIKFGFPLYFKPNNRYEHILIFRKGKLDFSQFQYKEKIDYREFKKYLSDVWEFPTVIKNQWNVNKKHVAEFPEKLPYLCISLYSLRNEIVLDPFLGSGTTMKVAKMLGRSCIGIEINREYEDMIKQKVGFGQKSLNFDVEYEIVSSSGSNVSDFSTRGL
jgi:DNA modification methylase